MAATTQGGYTAVDWQDTLEPSNASNVRMVVSDAQGNLTLLPQAPLTLSFNNGVTYYINSDIAVSNATQAAVVWIEDALNSNDARYFREYNPSTGIFGTTTEIFTNLSGSGPLVVASIEVLDLSRLFHQHWRNFRPDDNQGGVA